jgi:nucleotide-binding universal stress UspA family protein
VWPLRTIVVGYDGTRHSEDALQRAVELGQAFGANVIVVDVAALSGVTAAPGAFGLMPYDAGTAQTELEAGEALWREHRARVDALLTGKGVAHEFEGVAGQPTQALVDVAERSDADLVIVGTRDAGLFERMFAPSVSRGVARDAPCDVLIVRSESADEPSGS